MLHQHDKNHTPDKKHLHRDNQLRLANLLQPVLHRHPLLPRPSKLLVSSKKEMPPKMIPQDISHLLYLFMMRKLTWTLPLDPVRLV